MLSFISFYKNLTSHLMNNLFNLNPILQEKKKKKNSVLELDHTNEHLKRDTSFFFFSFLFNKEIQVGST
jgi:hypothetical protein